MKEGGLFYTLLLLFFILFAKNELGKINALIVEINPFYGLSNKKVKSVDSTTDDNLINIKLEHSPLKQFKKDLQNFSRRHYFLRIIIKAYYKQILT